MYTSTRSKYLRMSPKAGELLVQEIAPRIRNSLASSVPQVGAEDIGELVQDGIATAAALLDSAEARGKKVSAGNVAYYAVGLVRQGRRSTGQSRTDVMSPGTQIAGRCRLESLDQPIAGESEGDDILCLHDVLAAHSADPSQEAAKRLDWVPLVDSLDDNARQVLKCLVEGKDLTSLVPKLKRSRSALQNDKERLARLAIEHLGADILVEVQRLPQWRDNLVASRQKMSCRYERSFR
jgi:hypothetical protein